MDLTTRVIREGLGFGESPRWHGGRLWYSDFYRRGVFSCQENGEDERLEHEVPAQPSGLGWTPHGELWCVSMRDHRVIEPETGATIAELGDVAGFWSNDMLVTSSGVAYVGSFGFDLDTVLAEEGVEGLLSKPIPTTNLVVLSPDGQRLQVVADMVFPNGTVLIDSEGTLVIAETLASRLSAFSVAKDGTLSARRVHAELSGVAPDGICVDAQDAIWVANALSNECVLVDKDGQVRSKVATSQRAFACALGGEDVPTLYVMTAPTSDRFVIADQRVGRIEAVTVEVGAP